MLAKGIQLGYMGKWALRAVPQLRFKKGWPAMKLKKAGLITKIVIIAIVVYAGISLASLKRQTDDAREKRDELQQQVDQITQENSELQYDIDHSTDPEIIEDVARNDIGLVKPGEKIFYDISD